MALDADLVPLDDLIRRQGGVLALHQAVAGGMSAATVQRRAREGSWRRLHPAVYLLAGHRFTDEARVRAARLWAGEGAVVSGPAAAYWHGMLDRAPRPVELTVPRRRSPRCPSGVRVRRRDLAAVDIVGNSDMWLTAAPLTALETAVAMTRSAARTQSNPRSPHGPAPNRHRYRSPFAIGHLPRHSAVAGGRHSRE